MPGLRPVDDRRRAAGLFLGTVVLVYWLAVARPLFALAVASLVVAGERAGGPTGLDGHVPERLIPAVVAVELGVALRAAVTGLPVLGVAAGGLFLLAVRLNGPALATLVDSADGCPARPPTARGADRDPAD